ncbi:hypothetical protein [Psychroserpens sp. MEBiC05023]
MKRILITLCVTALCFSCTNNDASSNPPEANFYALTVGNSWVYKNYRYNQNLEIYEDTGVIDSVSIVSTEEINGHLYFKFRRLTTGNENGISLCNANGEHFELLRDDNGNLVSDNATIKFTNNDFSERLLNEQSWGSIMEILVDGETTLIVEAGTFNCINSERYAITSSGEQTPGLDRFYYADGIGLIYDTSSFVSQNIPTIIRRLDSYNIQ